ncbi:transcriptional regulator, BadM/Rrf2 family [Bradyrhizobium lablabi]|jgi:Rrf2 family protein|uniref:Transcriptional regulator, BadM/Rrf2 family n=1 Tax=Bradyrhizobium lablabi TaxID=722472 RepID=A0A1M7C0Q9_9BRAD|nr:Rrf2 family transcriptional regulator [Bradyrhizobium lablabi]SHL60787.1 transcriptional regulator, BadM/Rrf2 family [Bradyrhizobium lablabi]
MSANSQLTVAIHILSWMALVERNRPGPVTSERIALSVNTNPVVIRRALGLLQKAGLVQSQRGANAGWVLAKRPTAITLLDIYNAVETGPLFAMHHSTPNQTCPVGRGIQPTLKDVYGGLERSLRRDLAKTTVAQVLAETVD